MNAHAPILPILIPMAAALLQMASGRVSFQRAVGLLASALLVFVTGWLTLLADDGLLRVYALGDWPAPFGIVLVVDRLAAAMTLLTAILGFLVLLYASAGFDETGIHFHPLFQFQLLGLLGAFLTGDLFNLFVFFEIMLLASYVLLAHGGGLARTRAGISYVVLNLVGSALFLIALGLIYGTLGTLNLADVARALTVPGHDHALARLAFALLITVFALKAGLLPLSFWLPHTYGAAGAPVAALFAIMTKVGIVAILRVQAIALEPVMPDLLDNWLTTLALATVAFAALGALAATRLQALVAWLVLLSWRGWSCCRPAPCW
ncbi:MAG: Multiple resistance and pH homeostasis protein D [Candidatus Accumulibacter appositus]|uniref:Multiple resistance and pH homeostasis protein D n=1 Tax=Candidatus Accumulibacter appositus TaxID=1454003 RepID=A0A011NZW6_9PROT|nr:MAG: Multiple resistance and pH homeostasis protein D [Candidatus Accumulibacter appositus]